MKETIPAIVVSVIPLVLLALVSFNTPLLKSLYFLKADYAGFTATFGTLGYCTTGGNAVTNGTTVDANGCVGPTVGYTFDPDTIFGLSNPLFDIPTAITKYLTYVLILHVCALGTGVLGLFLSLLDLIPNFSLLCFPSLCTWLTSALALLAFIIDAIMFYIARARINAVSGASASVGICVWLTLAAWVTTALAGCFFGFAKCCAFSNKRKQRTNRDEREYQAMKQDQDARSEFREDTIARGKRAGPPVLPVKEEEVSVPLTATDKYDDDEYDKTGSVPYHTTQQVDGVGYGYGQRYPPQPPRQVTPTDRGYVPSSTAYQQPYAAQDPPANQYADPYASRPGTEYLTTQPTQATYSPANILPGLPPVNGQRSMTPASTYAGSFVGVGSGRHEGMPMPLPAGAAPAGYVGQQTRQGSGYDAYGGQQYSGYDNAQYPQQSYTQPQQGYPTPAQNPYAVNTTVLRPPTTSYEQARQSTYGNVSTQDACAAYEEPTSTTSAYPTHTYPANTRSPPPPLAPQPQRLQQLPDDYAMPERSPSPEYVQTRAQDAGPVGDAPPMYEAGGSGYPPQQQQQQGYARNEKGGYFN